MNQKIKTNQTAITLYIEGFLQMQEELSINMRFFSYMLYDQKLSVVGGKNMSIVLLNAFNKKQFIQASGSKAKDQLKAADRIIGKLVKKGYIKRIGYSTYSINPDISTATRISSEIQRDKIRSIYRGIRYEANGTTIPDAYLITKNGEKIDL